MSAKDSRLFIGVVLVLASYLIACESDTDKQQDPVQDDLYIPVPAQDAGGMAANNQTGVAGQPAAGGQSTVPTQTMDAGLTPDGGQTGTTGQQAPVTGQAGSGTLTGTGGTATAGSGGETVAGSGGETLAGSGGASGSGEVAGSDGTNVSGEGCTRDLLRSTVDAFYVALSANDPSTLSLSPNVKYTENGAATEVGQGLWTTAGETKFTRTALDTETCNTVTESVIAEGSADVVFGLRLALEGQDITEIEAIIVRQGDWFPTPQGILSTANDDWEVLLPPDKQPTRERLQFIVEFYFANFGSGLCDLAPECKRYENGFSPGGCDMMVSCGPKEINARPVMATRQTVLDTEAGIAVGFTMFMGAYTDFHMFHVGEDDQIYGVHAVLASSRTSGWD